MDSGTTGRRLGRLVDRARSGIAQAGPEIAARVRTGSYQDASIPQSGDGADSERTVSDSDAYDATVIDVDLSDALARAERAEAEVLRLQTELQRKEDILTEARGALRTARLALAEHLRVTAHL